LKKKRFLQYRGGVPGQNTFGHTSRLTAEELNDLSYLVRKYPKEAMQHLSFKDMREEVDSRGGLMSIHDSTIMDECVRRGMIKIN